jgi:uncharacterized protein YecE (DUF72 family)
MTVLVGTSGWQYRDWREPFYEGRPQRLWLSHYATRFATVEVNNAFYRLPERSVFERWREQTPHGFVVGVKVSRYLTHIKRLRDPAEPVARLVERADGLRGQLGPYLLQLPPNLPVEVDRLDECLGRFPTGSRVAVEPRHSSWWTDEVREVLARHGSALCWADRRSRALTPLWATAGWGYLRLHEGTASPWPSYGPRALASWLDRISAAWPATADVYVYFNNDQGAAAVRDATAFARAATRRGLASPWDGSRH